MLITNDKLITVINLMDDENKKVESISIDVLNSFVEVMHREPKEDFLNSNLKISIFSNDGDLIFEDTLSNYTDNYEFYKELKSEYEK